MQYLGLGKTKFNSSVCLLDENSTELLLSERHLRKKNSGAWPSEILFKINSSIKREIVEIAENRDVIEANHLEDLQDSMFPFYDYLKKHQLDFFTRKYNPNIQNVSHHLAHAYAALAMSPFEKSIIVVMDGAGSAIGPDEFEECSVYLQDKSQLKLISSQTIKFIPSTKIDGQTFGTRIGAAYEKISEYIFNSSTSSGKVMGLAPYGDPSPIDNFLNFLEELPWDKSYKGKSKSEWENLDHTFFKNLAATVQKKLEQAFDKIIDQTRKLYPEYNNLIITGGCALNCTNNARLLYQKKFEQIFIPPFPGDESISFGLAHYLKIKNNPNSWSPLSFDKQSAYFGLKSSIPNENDIKKEFLNSEYTVQHFADITDVAANLLAQNHIIAWFQGRSESGPRALGNRSILSNPNIKNLKNHLNKNIKYRESFRPYGCSVLYEKADIYFDVESEFNNPYMSYAIKVRESFKEILNEVSHIDGTSRMQTVREGQNLRFYNLIKRFGDLTNLYCLLNTSLNVMDEPILETVADTKRFMDQSPIEYLVIEDFLIQKKVNRS